MARIKETLIEIFPGPRTAATFAFPLKLLAMIARLAIYYNCSRSELVSYLLHQGIIRLKEMTESDEERKVLEY